MSVLELRSPDIHLKQEALNFRETFWQNDEHLYGCAYFDDCDTYEEWLERLEYFSGEDTLLDGLVPSTTYFAVRKSDRRIVGSVNIRHYLNKTLEQFYGHIGYSVRADERKKGYAHELLGLALEKCRDMGITEVIITCDKNNAASAGTIRSQGGVLQNEVITPEGTVTLRFSIQLKP